MPVERVEVGMPDCEECDSATVERSMARRVSDSIWCCSTPPRCDDCATQNSPTHSRSLASINAGLPHTSRSPNNPRPKTARSLARRGAAQRCGACYAAMPQDITMLDILGALRPLQKRPTPMSACPQRPPASPNISRHGRHPLPARLHLPPRYIPTQRPLQGGRHRRLTATCILQYLTRLCILTRAPQLAH